MDITVTYDESFINTHGKPCGVPVRLYQAVALPGAIPVEWKVSVIASIVIRNTRGPTVCAKFHSIYHFGPVYKTFGRAMGGGYNKASAAAQEAITRAGFRLTEDLTCDSHVRDALKAVARLLMPGADITIIETEL